MFCLFVVLLLTLNFIPVGVFDTFRMMSMGQAKGKFEVASVKKTSNSYMTDSSLYLIS